MALNTPRDFESWMRWVERELTQIKRAPHTTLIDLITRSDQKVAEQAASSGGGDTRTPAAPVSVSYQTAIYTGSNNETLASLSVTFSPVTVATDATALTVDKYELWGREWDGESQPEPEWKQIAVSYGTAFVVSPFTPGAVYRFRVRAIGKTTITPGLFSAETPVTFTSDVTPPPIPSAPQVDVVMGTFRVIWDGLTAAGNPMPADFAYVEIAAGPTSSPTLLTGRRLSRAGSEVFVGIPYGERRYFRLVAVDSSGNASGWSANAAGKATPLVSIDGISLDGILQAELETAQTTANVAAAARAAADALQADADNAQAAADQAQAEADAAQANYVSVKAAQDPVIMAETGTTSIVHQGTAPTGDPALAWVDTSASVVKLWTGTTWTPTSDEEAIAALALILAAQSAANQEQAEADAAQAAADQAQATADTAASTAASAEATAAQALADATATYKSSNGKSSITYSINDPSLPYTGAVGDTWWKRDGTGTVVGQWEWDGAAWQSVEVGSEVIANLDVGKLTASAALMDTLVAQKIAAESAQFIELAAENFSANLIEGDWLKTGAIQSQHMSVGSVRPQSLAYGIDNYAPNPVWTDVSLRLLYAPPSGWSYVTTPSLLQAGQSHVLAIPQGAQVMPIAPVTQVSPGDKFFLSVLAKRPADADWNPELRLQVKDSAGAAVTSTPLSIAAGQVQRVNLVHNPSFETNVTGFASLNSASVTRVTSQAFAGSASAEVTSAAVVGSGAEYALTAVDPVTAGEAYRASAWLRVPSGQAVVFRVKQYNASSVLVKFDSTTIEGTGAWQMASLDVDAESTANKITIAVDHEPATAITWHVDAARIETLRSAIDSGDTYFDGSVPGSSWAGTAHASSSSRTDVPDMYFSNEAVVTIPSGGVTIEPAFASNTGTAGTWHVSRVAIRRAFASSDQSQQGLEVTPSSLKMWGADDPGLPRVSFSTNTDDILTLTDSFDRPSLVLTGSGAVNARQVSASEGFTYRGTELFDILDDRSRVIAGTGQFPATISNVNSEYGLCELSWTVQGLGPRFYRFTAQNLYFQQYGNQIGIRVRITTNGTQPLVTPPSSLFAEYNTPPVAGSANVSYSPTFAGGNQFATVQPGTRIRALLSIYSITGTDFAWVNSNNPRFYVEDIGPNITLGGIISSGGGSLPGQGATPPPGSSAVQTYTSPITPKKWRRSYRGDGTPYDYDRSSLFQGYYLSHNGVLKFAVGAPDQMFSDLSGAEVDWIEVYLKNEHWYKQSGTLVMGVHGFATDPGSWPGTLGGESYTFTRGQSRWLRLTPAWHDGFKTQSYRGITAHAGGSTSTDYYGRFDAPSVAWRWRYRK